MSLDRRLQLLLDENRYRRVADLARQQGTSVAAVIRDAIDRGLPNPDRARSAAARQVLDAEPVDVPDIIELRAELEELRARRA
ncbi:MAG TPA: antitoxin [Mycobacteriales bacterium]|nr:antitoxin [Mycobacteriales bacterium]